MQTLFLLSAILAVQGAAILETPKTNLTKPEPGTKISDKINFNRNHFALA
jgi:hypothetical protein